MAAEYLQGWRLHNLPGQPVSVLGHLHSKKVFTDETWNLLCFGFCPLTLVLSLGTTEKRLAPSSLHPPFRYLHTSVIPLSFLFSRLSSASFLSLSSYERCSNGLYLHEGLFYFIEEFSQCQ